MGIKFKSKLKLDMLVVQPQLFKLVKDVLNLRYHIPPTPRGMHRHHPPPAAGAAAGAAPPGQNARRKGQVANTDQDSQSLSAKDSTGNQSYMGPSREFRRLSPSGCCAGPLCSPSLE
eukprot:402245-Pelagomonas_calceolata.AAC.1